MKKGYNVYYMIKDIDNNTDAVTIFLQKMKSLQLII